jgi:hypothetical protein
VGFIRSPRCGKRGLRRQCILNTGSQSAKAHPANGIRPESAQPRAPACPPPAHDGTPGKARCPAAILAGTPGTLTPGTFCSWFQKQRGEKGRGLQVSEGGNGALLAISNYWQFCTCLAEAEGRGLRELLAYQGWTVQLLALLLLFEAEGGRGVLVQDAVECTLLASGNFWHFCSKQFVRLLIFNN